MKIKYVGELLDHTGYGQAARINVALLHKMGHQVKCVPIGAKTSTDPDWKMQLVQLLMTTPIDTPDIIITHIYPPSNIQGFIEPNVPLIAYLAWETDMLPSLWTHHLNKYADYIITTCSIMKDIFIKSGVTKPVSVLGPTMFDEDVKLINVSKPTMEEIPSGLRALYNPDRFIFYSIFQWIERKDPTKLISAFIQEFDNTEDDVVLLMKTYRIDYSQEETKKLVASINTLNRELNIIYPPEVRIIPNRMSEHDLNILHRMGSCYVSPHRGEGSGLGIIDAIMHDRPVITTPFGGPSDFTSPDSTRWLKYQMIPIQNPIYCYNYFNSYMMWADVDIMDLRKAMRTIYENRHHLGNRNENIASVCYPRAREKLLDIYSYTNNAKTMNTILGSI